MNTWKIFVSDVEVGEIPDNTFEMMKRFVRRDPRVWVATALDFLRPMRQLSAVFTVPPLLIVWGMIFAALADPSTFAQVMELAATQPEKFRHGLMLALIYSVMLSAGLMVIRSFFTPSVFTAAYNRELGRRLRHLMKVPSDGEVRLERAVESIQP
ncbi:hypothetical protein [Pseudomonas sp. LB3P58]